MRDLQLYLQRETAKPQAGSKTKIWKLLRLGAVCFTVWLGVRVMQKQGHRGVVNDRSVIGQDVRPEHALHTRRSLLDESFVHVHKIDRVNTIITAKRATIQRTVSRHPTHVSPTSCPRLRLQACQCRVSEYPSPCSRKDRRPYSLLLCRSKCQLECLAESDKL